MEIDYTSMAALVDVRMKQIDDASKESPYFNREYCNLMIIRKAIADVILLERQQPLEYDSENKEIPFRGERSTLPRPSEMNAPMDQEDQENQENQEEEK